MVSESDKDRKIDTSYIVEMSNAQLANSMMAHGHISLYNLAQLLVSYPNDQELGENLRLLVKEKLEKEKS